MKKKERKNCRCCNKVLKRTHDIYCDNFCQQKQQYNVYIAKWKAGLEDGVRGKVGAISGHIRKYMFEKYGNQCQECGWNKVNKATGNIPLEIDHVDGNHRNNKEENLRLLCPNCHSLTPTYKGANKGSRNRTMYKSRY